MAITLDERPEHESPIINESTGETVVTVAYTFKGTNNYAALRTQVLLLSPVTIDYAGQVLGRRAWRPHFQPGEWGTVEVEYSSLTTAEQAIQPEGPPGSEIETPVMQVPQDGDRLSGDWVLSTRGGTRHVTQSKETIHKLLVGGAAAPDNARAIGLNADGVQGVDLPALKLQISLTFPLDLRLPLVRTLARIDEPKTNSEPWLGFAENELLYVGAEARGNTAGPASMTIHLEGGENLEQGDPRLNLDGGTLILPSKKAHDYVWVKYLPAVEGVLLYEIPYAAYVERVYDEMNFQEVFGFG